MGNSIKKKQEDRYVFLNIYNLKNTIKNHPKKDFIISKLNENRLSLNYDLSIIDNVVIKALYSYVEQDLLSFFNDRVRDNRYYAYITFEKLLRLKNLPRDCNIKIDKQFYINHILQPS